jgi:N-acetylglutamate synthase-like GNAT family acetyltransferase
MEIRKANEDDILFLIDLIYRIEKDREVAKKRASRIKSSERIILVLEEDFKLIGYVGLIKEDDDIKAKDYVDIKHFACLTWIGVDPDFRKAGNGSKLILACDEVAKEWGKVGIWLDCREKVIPFYIRNGYQVRGHYRDSGRQRYVLAKEI